MDLKSSIEHILSKWKFAIKEVFSGHELGAFFRGEFRDVIREKVDLVDQDWEVRSSVGAGNWANVPWLSILSPIITNGTQDGVYPVYLFCGDGSGVYLSLAQGVVEPEKQYGKKQAGERALIIKNRILENIPELRGWDSSRLNLKARTALGKSYEDANIAAKFYPAEDIPSNEILYQDLHFILTLYKRMESMDFIPGRELLGTKEVRAEGKTEIPKPFLLLAGISGTGKSRFIREQARKAHPGMENFCLVAVRPDWHEPSDLLGYISRLSGSPNYVVTDVLRFIVDAWKALHQAGVQLSGRNSRTRIYGKSRQLEAIVPYWLCLDEMNLAPVEQYLADYLSLIETREWHHSGDDFSYLCDAILKPGVLTELETAAQHKLASVLGLEETEQSGADHALWSQFLAHGIAIPPNLIVVGTVNTDETTHGFSRKVIDRAMSFDFGEFFPNDFVDFYAGEIAHAALTFPRHAAGSQAIAEEDAQPSIEFLQALNNVLRGSPFELAYRALNELLLAVHCHGSPAPGRELQAVWDDFLMQKVLPRIEGDVDKLQGDEDGNLLSRLYDLLEIQLVDIWSEGSRRPDFYRFRSGNPMSTGCRSKRKIKWMLDRLSRSGFTSFWP